ncbi:thioredoxin family protein [Pseudomonas solani]|uniref:Glutaredoxin domain-containing protein n=1 Tax=Pseudomonas solani TaxID=2731552 RepID=A0AAU7YA16_9PSED|nr:MULTISPECIES: glutaredoxin domain-containing protein [Pseudomonas]EQM71857.1 thioredoxin [Pseudomonas alcaligenes OT 69]MBB4821493.1 glutaredoxin [Pseudomonas alcaligenes]MDN4147776.1 glutaredoxin domain-containing protein [Pseudomonas tohonis]MCU9949977.1 thioredoxin family protein [Pseudomonas sp. PDM13]BCD87261.1 thioredoxin family protein [Pseudomonas solani]
MTQARYYHAGCPVCVEAERTLIGLLDPKVKVEIVHLGDVPARVAEAESAGVKSVPALVVDGQVLHLNFGAAIADLK